MVMPERWPGPYIAAASFVETTIEGKDGAITLVRMVDTLTIHEELPADPEVTPVVQQRMVVVLKSGNFQGNAQVDIVGERPDGTSDHIVGHTVPLTGEERGVNIRVNVTIGIRKPGLAWFAVVVNGSTLTRVPLRIIHSPRPSPERVEDQQEEVAEGSQ